MMILPAILVNSAEDFAARLSVLPKSCDTVSVDLMDATMTDARTLTDARPIKKLNSPLQFELDVMSKKPLPLIQRWAGISTVIRAIVHAEIPGNLRDTLHEIHALGLESGIAVLPSTPIGHIEHLLNSVSMVLVRGNTPGQSGKPFLRGVLPKIEMLHREYPHIHINVDIGVNADTIPDIARAGATHACVNSAIFGAKDPARAYRELAFLAQRRS